MRALLVVLSLAGLAAAQGLPPPSRIDSWESKKNQKRLAINWDGLPRDKPTKLPDGSIEKAKAPWPFLLYIAQADSKSKRKIQDRILADTRFALATRLCPIIQVNPEKAIDLKYLASVSVRDPTLVVCRRDFSVVGTLRESKEFTDKKCLSLMARAVDGDYNGRLGKYLTGYIKLMREAEKLWKTEQKIEDLSERAGKKSKVDQARIFKEVEQLEKELLAEEEKLLDKEDALKASMRIKADKEEEIATTVGKGKKKRELTPEELEAIRAFKKFSRDKNPIVRAAAVEDLGAVDSAIIVDYILKATNDTDPRVPLAAGRGLAKMKSDESLAAIHAGLKSGKTNRIVACLIAFKTISYGPAVRDIVTFVDRGADEMRRRAMEALVNQKDPAAIQPLIRALDGSVRALRVLAAVALGELKAKEAAQPLLGKLDASDWSMKKAAAEALARIRVKETIAPLLERFEAEKGLMKEVLHDTLVSITGQDFKYRMDGWKRWWKRYGPTFKVPTEREVEIARAKARAALKGYARPNERKYHRIKTMSTKIIFIIDISASMKDKVVIPATAPDWVKERYPDRVKMEIAKKELIEVLAGLKPNVYFNIVTFAGRVKSWKPNLVSGTSKNSAIKWVAKLKPIASGGRRSSGTEQKTNTYGALMVAFGLADEAVPNWKARTKVDTIFLVTDGVPTVGEIIEVPKLVAAITDMNRSRGVVIHLICFDKIAAKRLKYLAESNGGEVVVQPSWGENPNE